MATHSLAHQNEYAREIEIRLEKRVEKKGELHASRNMMYRILAGHTITVTPRIRRLIDDCDEVTILQAWWHFAVRATTTAPFQRSSASRPKLSREE